MEHTKPSFVRGIFAGQIHAPLLFPSPPTLDERDPAEARVVRRLIPWHRIGANIREGKLESLSVTATDIGSEGTPTIVYRPCGFSRLM